MVAFAASQFAAAAGVWFLAFWLFSLSLSDSLQLAKEIIWDLFLG
jgi:hypothetical protein